MIESAAAGQRLLQRWREADPWLTMLAATVALTFGASPQSVRGGVLAFIGAGIVILAIGVFGVPILCSIIESLIRPDVLDAASAETEDVVDFVRVSRVVIVILVVLLWGWTPSSAGSDDPGDREPASLEKPSVMLRH